MSWAEDNGIDSYDDSYDFSDIEQSWKEGIHIDRNKIKHKLLEMKTDYLKNCIKYFEGLGADTIYLERELTKRS